MVVSSAVRKLPTFRLSDFVAATLIFESDCSDGFQAQPAHQETDVSSGQSYPMIERQSDSRARAWRNGIRSGLKESLSARREIGDAELPKFGETLNDNPEPSPERNQPGRCRD